MCALKQTLFGSLRVVVFSFSKRSGRKQLESKPFKLAIRVYIYVYWSHAAMLKRALRRASRSSSFSKDDDDDDGQDTEQGKAKKPRPKPTSMGTPLMMMALSKVAKGQSAGIVSEACKAGVRECGPDNVAESISGFILVKLCFITPYVH